MKKVLYFAGAALAALLIYKTGLAAGGMILLLAGIAIYMIKSRMELKALLERYATRYENIYVVSREPETEEEHSFKGDLNRLIVWADYRDVVIQVRKEEALLRQAGNTFFTDPGLREDQRLKVIPIIFRDGAFVNESWKDFRGRIRETIEADRVAVHSNLKEANPDWYDKFANQQNGVTWEL